MSAIRREAPAPGSSRSESGRGKGRESNDRPRQAAEQGLGLRLALDVLELQEVPPVAAARVMQEVDAILEQIREARCWGDHRVAARLQELVDTPDGDA